MKPIVKELLFQAIGHLHEYWEETKDKNAYKLKQSIAKYMYNEHKDLDYYVNRSGLKLNSTDKTIETNMLLIGLCCVFEAINHMKESKLTNKWITDGMKLYIPEEETNRSKALDTCRLLAEYPYIEEDVKE